MTRSRRPLLDLGGRLAAVGGGAGIAAGAAQATIGSRIPDWSGNKDQPIALGLLTMALAASVVWSTRPLRAASTPRDEILPAITLWLTTVAVVCSTTVGRLWVAPGVLLLAAAAATLAACSWHRFRITVADNWLCGLLGILGVFDLLMAANAGPAVTVATGLVAGGALITGAIVARRPGRRMLVGGLIAITLPFAILTWWTIVTPLLTVVAFGIGLALTGRRTGAPIQTAPGPLSPQPGV